MALLIILLVVGIILIMVGSFLTKENSPFKKNDCLFIGIMSGIIVGASFILIMSELRDYNFQTNSKPQIDTVITYHSVDQVIDTTYFYKFK